MPKRKCSLRTGKVPWPELEQVTSEWVLENKQNGYVITRQAIRLFALQWAKANPSKAKSFLATPNWCGRFMERYGLVLRQKTKLAQKLPAQMKIKLRLSTLHYKFT